MRKIAVIGDDIALGVAAFMPGCDVNAKPRFQSGDVAGCVMDARILVVSAGTNDPYNPRLADNLKSIRQKATGRVLWIIPANGARPVVERVAAQYGDRTVRFSASESGHPQSFPRLAASVLAEVRT